MSERPFTIRNAKQSDSAGILDCLRAAFEIYRHSYTPEAFVNTVLTPDTLGHRFAAMSVFVAESALGEIVGTIGCQVIHSVPPSVTASNSKEGHIRGMAVLPGWHGSGVAAQLLRSVESELRARGCSKIGLDTTEPLKAAMRFYEKHGFRRSGRLQDFFGMTLIEYVKTLAE